MYIVDYKNFYIVDYKYFLIQLGKQKLRYFSRSATLEKSSLSENSLHTMSLWFHSNVSPECQLINFQSKQAKIHFDDIFLHLSAEVNKW